MNVKENGREKEKKNEERMKMVDWPLAIIDVALFQQKSFPPISFRANWTSNAFNLSAAISNSLCYLSYDGFMIL